MVIVGIILSFLALAYLCWLLFALAVNALPVFAAFAAGFATYSGSSGPIAAIIVGTVAGVITLVAGQIAFTALRSPVARSVLALLFAAPAAVAGYHAAHGIALIALPASGWQNAIAIAGAIIVAATAWLRMTTPARCRAGHCCRSDIAGYSASRAENE